MDDLLPDEPLVDLEGIRDVPVDRAAYVLGRNGHLIEGWLWAVQEVASTPERPWAWGDPFTNFGTSFEVPPIDLIDEINDSLRALVQAGVVDGPFLTELHRALDQGTESCLLIAEYAQWDQRDELCETYWQVVGDIHNVYAFQRRLLVGNAEVTRNWRELGDRLGELLYFLSRGSDPEILSEFKSFTTLAGRLLPPDALAKFTQLSADAKSVKSPGQTWEITRQLINAIQLLDQRILATFSSRVAAFPYLVLDEQRRVLGFLGVDIPFEQFAEAKANGGLTLLCRLIRQPGSVIRASQLVAECGLAIDANHISQYFSRLRSVIRSTEDNWPAGFRSGPNQAKARQAFIRADQTVRKLAHDKDTWYKLDLSADRIRHIEQFDG